MITFNGEYDDILGCYRVAFRTIGTAPVVSGRVMDAFVAYSQFAAACESGVSPHFRWALQWDGNGVMATPAETPVAEWWSADNGQFWIFADEAGNYDLSPLSADLSAVSEGDRVVQIV